MNTIYVYFPSIALGAFYLGFLYGYYIGKKRGWLDGWWKGRKYERDKP